MSVTITLLQEQVLGAPSILGVVGSQQRRKGPRGTCLIEIPSGEDKDGPQQAQLLTQPNIQLPSQSSVQNRIWNSINHRWLALYILEHLFRQAHVPWNYSDALIYSFQMMASCGPSRFDFLSPLAGYCLIFHSQEPIDLRRDRLNEIWKDPSSFLAYGNTCISQLSIEARSRIIISCFQELRSFISSNHKQLCSNPTCKAPSSIHTYHLSTQHHPTSNISNNIGPASSDHIACYYGPQLITTSHLLDKDSHLHLHKIMQELASQSDQDATTSCHPIVGIAASSSIYYRQYIWKCCYCLVVCNT